MKTLKCFLLFLFVAITGCNGGGGSSHPPTTINTITVKKTDPPLANSIAFRSAHVPLIAVRFTAAEKDVAVGGVEISCDGTGITAIESVMLVDQNNKQVGAPQILNSNHRATIGGIITVGAKTSPTFFVVGNMTANLSTVNGQQVTCSIVNISVNETVDGFATVVALFPIIGATVTMNDVLPLGTVNVSTSPASPAYTIAVSGSTDVVNAKYCYTTSVNGKLTQVGFKLVSGSPDSVVRMTVWNGEIMLGAAIFAGTNITIITLNQNVSLVSNVCTELTVKVDTARIGVGFPGVEGDIIKIEVDPTNTTAIDNTNGSTVGAVGTTEIPGVRMFSSVPSCLLDPLATTGTLDGKLIRIKCLSATNGDIDINQLKFKVETSGLSMTGVNLFGCLNKDCTSPIPGFVDGQILPSHIPFTVNNGTISIAPMTPVKIPAGMTYYFELRALGVSSTSAWSAITTMLGDISPPTPGTVPEIFGRVISNSDNMLWTPNPGAVSPIMVNDAGVSGLSPNGLVQSINGSTVASAPVVVPQPYIPPPVVTPPPSCGNGLNIISYPSCTCPSGQVPSGSVCVLVAPPPPGPI